MISLHSVVFPELSGPVTTILSINFHSINPGKISENSYNSVRKKQRS